LANYWTSSARVSGSANAKVERHATGKGWSKSGEVAKTDAPARATMRSRRDRHREPITPSLSTHFIYRPGPLSLALCFPFSIRIESCFADQRPACLYPTSLSLSASCFCCFASSVAPIALGATHDHTQLLHLTTSAPPCHAYQQRPSLSPNFI